MMTKEQPYWMKQPKETVRRTVTSDGDEIIAKYKRNDRVTFVKSEIGGTVEKVVFLPTFKQYGYLVKSDEYIERKRYLWTLEEELK